MTRVFGLDSQLAVTVFSSVVVPHESRGEISEADLENYLSKAVWKSFDVLRKEAAERLGVSEIDLILAGARVVGMKVDGHEVLNPHGFVGRTLEISLCITMVKRGVLESGKDKNNEAGVEIFEKGSAAAYLLSRLLGLSRLLYIEIEDDKTKLFLVTPIRTSYLNEFDWGKSHIAETYASSFGVPTETAFEIYGSFIKGDVSLTVLEKMRRVFYSAFKKFIDGLTVNVKNFPDLDLKRLPPIYIRSNFPLPEEMSKRAFMLGKKRARFISLDKEMDIGDLVNNSPYNAYEWLNQLARRRIRWLMP